MSILIGASSVSADAQPKNDEERRKQADARRPLIMRRILICGMDDPLDLDRLNHEEPSDGRTRIKKDGRRWY
jgi:hypothetical protein